MTSLWTPRALTGAEPHRPAKLWRLPSSTTSAATRTSAAASTRPTPVPIPHRPSRPRQHRPPQHTRGRRSRRMDPPRGERYGLPRRTPSRSRRPHPRDAVAALLIQVVVNASTPRTRRPSRPPRGIRADLPPSTSYREVPPADSARTLAADGVFQRIHTLATEGDAGGHVLGISPVQKTHGIPVTYIRNTATKPELTYAPGTALGRRIRARDGNCRFPNCQSRRGSATSTTRRRSTTTTPRTVVSPSSRISRACADATTG